MQLKLAFSGGGFRATFYCLGAYRRLVELGIHNVVTQISSVSGGSIAAGAIMVALAQDNFQGIDDFDKRVTTPLCKLGQINLRRKLMFNSVIPRKDSLGLYLKPELPRTRFSRLFPQLLNEYLFKGFLMRDLPEELVWSCNSTCLNTLKRFRFKMSNIYAGNLGHSEDMSDITVAFAVASSAAFPMMFSPLKLSSKNRKFIDEYGTSHFNESPDTIYLTDGGVYDNLGSEEVLKDDSPYIIMDASAGETSWSAKDKPSYWKLNYRVLSVSLDQIINLRRRLIFKQQNGIQMLIGRSLKNILESEKRYRILKKELPEYQMENEIVERLIGGLRTDLDAFHDVEIEGLIWSGAVRMDLAIKSLLPDLILEEKWNETPLLSNQFSSESIKKILTLGQNRKNLFQLHRKLSI